MCRKMSGENVKFPCNLGLCVIKLIQIYKERREKDGTKNIREIGQNGC